MFRKFYEKSKLQKFTALNKKEKQIMLMDKL